MEKLTFNRPLRSLWHKRVSFMLLVALLLSVVSEPMSAWGLTATGSTEQSNDNYFRNPETGETHELTSTYSTATIKYNTDTYYTVPGVTDENGNKISISMREIADCDEVDKDFNGADTNCGFKYNAKENDEYVTGDDFMKAVREKYGDDMVGTIAQAVAGGAVPYSYNTINAYNAGEISADDASGYAQPDGRYVLSETYSLDGWYADEGTPEYEAAHKAMAEFYGVANWSSNKAIQNSATYRTELTVDVPKWLTPTPIPTTTGPVPTTGTPTPTAPITDSVTKTPTPPPTDTPTPEPKAGIHYYPNWPAGAVGTGGSTSSDSKTYGGIFTIRFPNYKCSNFHFTSWNTNNKGGGDTYMPGQTKGVYPNGNSDYFINLYAQWEPNAYVVTYDYNADWCVHPAELTKGPVGDSLKGGQTVNVYTDIFNYVTYRTDPDDAIIYAGQKYVLPSPTMRGYDFKGWSFLENEDGNGFWGMFCTKDTLCEATSNHYLYAVWDPCKYKVTLDFNFDYGRTKGIEGVTAWKNLLFSGDFIVTFGEQYKFLPEPQRVGYTFKGWYTSEEGNNGTGEQVLNTTRCDISNDHTLYAKWEPVTVTLTYSNVTGDERRDPVQVTYDELFGEEMLYTPEREGWTFVGWNDDINGDGTWLKPDMPSYFVIDSNIYAIFTPDDFVLTLDYNWMYKREAIDPMIDGVAVTVAHNQDKVSVTFNDNYPDDLPVPSREGYTFKGWWLVNEDGSWGERITHSKLVDIPRNHTAKAQWDPNMIRVELDYNNDGDSKYFSREDPTQYHYYRVILE